MKKLIVLMSSILLSANLWAEGGVIGGGGMGVVCKSPEGVQSVTLLDIYEAQIAGKKFIELKGEISDDLLLVAEKFYPNNIEKQATFWTEALSLSWRFKDIPEGTVLSPTNDALPAVVPKNCEIRQIASYQNPSLVYIDPELYGKMDYLSQLALVVHEYVYKIEREGGVSDSRYARLLTRMALEADDLYSIPWTNARLENIGTAIKRCESVGRDQESEFFVFPEGYEVSTGTNLVVFSKLNGHNMLTLNGVVLPFPQEGEKTSMKVWFMDTGMTGTEMEFKSNSKGLFLSWSGHFPGDKFKNVEFVCEDL